ncbi:Restriction enzyme BgcI subunit beta [Clostridioides difficile]|nr:Restriction enzyme BgcI subunit beta [Clostridioides difficile]
MNKIDITNWKEFEIGKLFIVKRPAKRSQSYYDDGDIPFVASGNYNNGIIKYCQPLKGEKLDKSNCITVSPLDGSAFYQKYNFLGRGGAGSAIILLYNDKLNLMRGLFIASVIRNQLTKYSYNDQLSSSVIVKEKIKLPSSSSGEPDWDYMEDYMNTIKSRVCNSLLDLESVRDIPQRKIDVSDWGEFHLYDKNLFTIDAGTKLDKVKMDMNYEEISFVGRSNMNNGITAKVKMIEGLKPYKKGNLTLALGGAYLGSCFVQPDEFYTSQNVVVLIPNHEMSYNVKQFIASTIFVESQNNYQAFIKELNAHIKRDFRIKLPIITDGTPDWDYMEKYMQQMQAKAEQLITCFI